MNNFGVIFKHYLGRSLREKRELLLLIAIPLGIMLLNLAPALAEGIDISTMGFMPWFVAIMVLSFQFFGGGYILDYVLKDFRTDMRFRLLSAPISKGTFIFALAAANFVMTLIPGIIVLLVMMLGFGVNMGSLAVLTAIMLLVCTVSNLFAVIVVLLAPTKKLAGGIHLISCFVLMFGSGSMPFTVDSEIADFLFTNGTPITLGVQAILEGGDIALRNMGIYGIIIAGLSAVVFVLTRRKPI